VTLKESRQEAARLAQIDASSAKSELMRIEDRLRNKGCTRAADALGSIIGDRKASIMAHTPGPWIAQTWVHERGVILTGDRTRRVVPLHGPALAYLPQGREDIMKANALLIAAAPELLEACRKVVEMLSGEDPAAYCDSQVSARDARDEWRMVYSPEAILKSVEAAIAKAERGA
jgi:hypothetical protein